MRTGGALFCQYGEMLHPFDDYPIHQVGQPLLDTALAHPNTFDRYFFNGYSPTGDVFFALAFGLYPGRQVIDAGFNVLRGGEQVGVLASGRIPLDRTATRVGPISIDIVEPMRVLRIVVEESNGVAAELLFTARTVAVEEPPFRDLATANGATDYTRFTQFGSWTGRVVVDGDEIPVDATFRGCRDRSWGIRTVGQRVPAAPATSMGTGFWLWAPVNFDDACTHLDCMEFPDGRRKHDSGFVIPVRDNVTAPVHGGAEGLATMANIEHDVAWKKGTRWAEHASFALVGADGTRDQLDFEPLTRFQMGGIGYFDPEWSHGTWRGENEVIGRRLRTADVDPTSPSNFHVQNLCRVTWTSENDGHAHERIGLGTCEHVVFGPHAPSGFRGPIDVAG